MLEVIVSMVIFGIAAVVVAGLIVNALGLTKSNTERTTAANLAAEQIEAIRDTRTLDIPDGQTVLPDRVVGGTSYGITQTANFIAGGASSSVCTGTSNQLSYKLVTVVVTWPGMGSVQPVRSDTLRSLGIGVDGLDQRFGALAALVQGSAGELQSGVQVTLMPGGTVRTTGIDGCAMFVGLDPAVTYTVSVNQPGYVGIDGGQLLTKPNAGIRPGEVTRAVLNYQQAGALRATLTPPPGFLPPARLSLTLKNTLFAPSTERAFPDCVSAPGPPQGCVAGTPRTAAALYPGFYGAWAGTCADAAPAPLPDNTLVRAGAIADTTVGLGGLTIEVRNLLGLPVTGKTVYAVHLADSGCLGGESWPLLPDLASDLQAALPLGWWTLALTPDASGPPVGGWPRVRIATPAAVPAPVVVLAP
jgi:hypothetical protein